MVVHKQILPETERQLNDSGLFLYAQDLIVPDSGLSLLYSPMARKAMWIDPSTVWGREQDPQGEVAWKKAVDELADFIPLKDRTRKVKSVADYPLLTVLPNQKCNLSCSYCYSARGRSGAELDLQTLKHTIDFFIRTKTSDRPLSVSYMGGGEPMLSWTLLSESMDYAREQAAEAGKKIDFTIITNGTVLTEKMLAYIRAHHIQISISFEIIEEIQNRQRGQYPNVVRNIQRLIDNQVIPQINSTLTPGNVERMTEMYELLDRQFPEITHMMFEPVTAAGLFAEGNDLDNFLKTYTRHFLAIDREARKKNKSLTSFPYLRTVFPTERACAGEFCLTPDGKLSGCYCVSVPGDPAYERTVYGEVTSRTEEPGNPLRIDEELFTRLLEENVYNKSKCAYCPVKWNCGGGCFYLCNSYPETYQDIFCDFTKDFVRKVVLQRFERLYSSRFGITPHENLSYIRSHPVILSMK